MENQVLSQNVINNQFYDTLHESWYTADDHPIALLRAENAVRTPWIHQEIIKRLGTNKQVLDVGCGAGLLTNYLSASGHHVTGIDISQGSLEVAKRYDTTAKVRYLHANAYALPFKDNAFDVVCAMDILEHVEDYEKLLKEASRVLRPGGLFFFHTFNRNLFSYLLVIKGVDWFVKNAPPNMHVYHLFITPKELEEKCRGLGLKVDYFTGLIPVFFNTSFVKLLLTRRVDPHFKFRFSRSLSTGYCGIASKLTEECY